MRGHLCISYIWFSVYILHNFAAKSVYPSLSIYLYIYISIYISIYIPRKSVEKRDLQKTTFSVLPRLLNSQIIDLRNF